MVWFRVDDGFAKSRKVLSIPKRRRLSAIGAWTLAGTWSAAELTDGFIPHYALEDIPGAAQCVPDLLSAELWREADGGYQFHDWEDYQPAKADVVKERERHAARQRAYRDRKQNERDTVRVASRDASVTRHVTQQSQWPDPTRPDPTVLPMEVLQKPPSPTPLVHPSFDEFWDLYPRKVGKLAAQKAYLKAVRLAGADVVLAGVARLANDPNLPKDRTLIPHANTWLNGGRWADEAYPAPGVRPQRGEPRYFNSAPNQMRIEI